MYRSVASGASETQGVLARLVAAEEAEARALRELRDAEAAVVDRSGGSGCRWCGDAAAEASERDLMACTTTHGRSIVLCGPASLLEQAAVSAHGVPLLQSGLLSQFMCSCHCRAGCCLSSWVHVIAVQRGPHHALGSAGRQTGGEQGRAGAAADLQAGQLGPAPSCSLPCHPPARA